MPLIKTSDYNIVNLECSPDVHRGKQITKVGPHLSCSRDALLALKESGFHCLALANNHFADFGPDSVIDSIRLIDSMGFDHVGAGDNLTNAGKPLIVSLQGKRIAIINCCEHEFTLANEKKAGCNPIDPINQSESIRNASNYADYVFVYVHGGNEHYNLPTPRMLKIYRFFIDCGADLVVNCHQHLFSGYEYYQGKPIVYGLGNFFFDIPERINMPWNYGYVLHVSIIDKLAIELIPYKQCNGEPTISLLNVDEQKVFQKQISDINSLIQSPQELHHAYDKLVSDNALGYLYPLSRQMKQTYLTRKWKHLKHIVTNDKDPLHKGLTEEQQLLLYSYTHCESHRDIFVSILAKLLQFD